MKNVEQFVIDQAAKHGISVQKWGADAFRVQIWEANFNGIVGLDTLAGMVARAEENK